jgi:hypothetical protein
MFLLKNGTLARTNCLQMVKYDCSRNPYIWTCCQLSDPSFQCCFQLGAEIRIPVRNTHVYAFAEHGNDLGTSKDVKGNPTEVYRRMGHGSSYGVGVKLGLVRAEYAVDHNTGNGSVFFRFGERY